MDEIIIKTKRGIYGRVSVTLPLTIKTSMLDWQKRSGMKKAEFLRFALTTGFLVLSKGIVASDADQSVDGAQLRTPGAVPVGVAYVRPLDGTSDSLN